MALWLVKLPNSLADPQRLFDESMIAANLDVPANLSTQEDMELLKIHLRRSRYNSATADSIARQCWQFAREVKPGDIILVLSHDSSIACLGIVTGDYKHSDGTVGLAHRRAAQWSNVRLPYPDCELASIFESHDVIARVANDRLVIDILTRFKSTLSAPSQFEEHLQAELEREISRLQGVPLRVQRYSSPELHHFVARSLRPDLDKVYGRLLDILKSGHLTPNPSIAGYHPHTVTIDPNRRILDEAYIKPACICFCDIPSDDIHLHTEKYGRFGLSLAKNFAFDAGARPVIYVPWSATDWRGAEGRPMLKRLEDLHRKLIELGAASEDREVHLRDLIKEALLVVERDIISFVKPFSINLPDDHERQYYLEREWRLLGSIKFSLDDVVRVFLPRQFAKQFRQDLPDYKNQLTFV